MDVRYDVHSEPVHRYLSRMDTAFSSIAWAAFLHVAIAPYLQERAKARFANEGDDVVGPWLPLTETTKRIRVSQGFGEGPINHRTGELERYITQGQIDTLAVGPVATLTMPGTEASGELKDKMETAQKGRAYPRTPPRPVLGMNQNDLIFVVSEMSIYARKVVRT